jgi:hypothetical protein
LFEIENELHEFFSDDKDLIKVMQQEMLDNMDVTCQKQQDFPSERNLSLSPSLVKNQNTSDGMIPLLTKPRYEKIVKGFKEFDGKYSLLFIRNTIKDDQRKSKSVKYSSSQPHSPSQSSK